MKAYPFKFALIGSAVVLAIWSIWADENRMKLALTALVLIAAWGVWLAVDRHDPHDRTDDPEHPIEQSRVGQNPRGPERRP